MDYKEKFAEAGNAGGKTRSDCQFMLEPTLSGGITISMQSRVKALYGDSIEILIREVLGYFDIQHMNVGLVDTGALNWVIAARLEAAIIKLLDTDKEFLTGTGSDSFYQTPKDQFRFSRLYLPGNSPGLMINAGLHKPNGLILDLEDAVAYGKKHEARYLVRNALRNLNFYGAEKMVRINQVPMGIEDLSFIVPHGVNLILLPKCESGTQVELVNKEITRIKKIHRISREIWLMPIIESALGVIKAYEIASSADNVVAMAIGLEDYTADLGCRRSLDGRESFFARSSVVNACKAAGIQAIDSVFSDVSDVEGLVRTVQESKSLGFDGMGCIHPRQIKVIHENFAPAKEELEKACKIVSAFDIAASRGLGVVSLGSKMIDPPVVKRAEKIVNLGIELGLLDENWRDNNE